MLMFNCFLVLVDSINSFCSYFITALVLGSSLNNKLMKQSKYDINQQLVDWVSATLTHQITQK